MANSGVAGRIVEIGERKVRGAGLSRERRDPSLHSG
jgi:hypothetical protein